jgi:hypothetical protein
MPDLSSGNLRKNSGSELGKAGRGIPEGYQGAGGISRGGYAGSRSCIFALQKRANVLGGAFQVDLADPGGDRTAPGPLRRRLAGPARLAKRIPEPGQIRRGPFGIAQIPGQVMEIPPVQVRPAQDRVQLAGQQRGTVVVAQAQDHVDPDQPGFEPGPLRRAGVHLHLDRQRLVPVRGEADLVEQPVEADPSGVNRPPIIQLERDGVAFPRELGASRAQLPAKIERTALSFEGEFEIFREARDGEEESKRGSAVKGQARHRPRPLEGAQDPRLEVLANDVPPASRVGSFRQNLPWASYCSDYRLLRSIHMPSSPLGP